MMNSTTILSDDGAIFEGNMTTTSLADTTTTAAVSKTSSTTPHQQQNQRRLEFVHIPKTGGTSIEDAFSKKEQQQKGGGRRWGACHFMSQRTSRQVSQGNLQCPKSIPKLPPKISQWQKYVYANFTTYGCRLWHTPPYIFNPPNLPSEKQSKYNPHYKSDLFVVIRNPYERIISRYYYKNSRQSSQKSKSDQNLLLSSSSPEHMNQWIIDSLKPRLKYNEESLSSSFPFNSTTTKGYCNDGGHFIPQYRFIYDPFSQKQIVKHILRFEDEITSQLNSLLQSYNYTFNLTLPYAYKMTVVDDDKGENSNNNQTSSATNTARRKKWTPEDLTNETKTLIQKVYAKDFELLNHSI